MTASIQTPAAASALLASASTAAPWATLSDIGVVKLYQSRDEARSAKTGKVFKTTDPVIQAELAAIAAAEEMAAQKTAAKAIAKASGKAAKAEKTAKASARDNSPEEIAEAYETMNNQMAQGRNICLVLRHTATAHPEIKRAAFLQIAGQLGINLGTAARQFQEIRSGKIVLAILQS
jgi:hypothetical protein